MSSRFFALSMLCGGLVAAAPAAGALTILPNPIQIDQLGDFHAQVELVEVVNGLPVGADWVLGAVSPTSLTLVFQVRIDPLSTPADFGLTMIVRDALDQGIPFAGSGVISGADADWDILGGDPDGTATFVQAVSLPGTVFDRIFLSYDVPLATDGSLRIEAGFPFGNLGGGSAQIVPEPGTAALLCAGLVLLARRSRRARAGAAASLR